MRERRKEAERGFEPNLSAEHLLYIATSARRYVRKPSRASLTVASYATSPTGTAGRPCRRQAANRREAGWPRCRLVRQAVPAAALELVGRQLAEVASRLRSVTVFPQG